MKISVSDKMKQLDEFDRELMIVFLTKMSKIKPKSTLKLYQSVIRSFSEFLVENKLSIKDISPVVITDYIIFLAGSKNKVRIVDEGLSPETIRTRIFNLKTFVKWLVKEEHLDKSYYEVERLFAKDNLVDYMPKRRFNLPKPIHLKDIYKLLNECPAKWRCMLELMILTGSRIGEICNIRISDIERDFLEIRIKQDKTGQQKIAPITQNALNLIDDYLDNIRKEPLPQYKEFLFINKLRRKMSPNSVRDFLKIHSSKVLSYPVTPKQFRSSFATILAAAGASKDEIKELGGWEESKTLDFYVAYGQQMNRKTLEKYHPMGQKDAKRKEREKKRELLKQLQESDELMFKLKNHLDDLKEKMKLKE